MGGERGQIVNGLNQISFTLTVIPGKQIYTRPQLHIGGYVIPEVCQSQMCELHFTSATGLAEAGT